MLVQVQLYCVVVARDSVNDADRAGPADADSVVEIVLTTNDQVQCLGGLPQRLVLVPKGADPWLIVP